jgi:hypothetical protein
VIVAAGRMNAPPGRPHPEVAALDVADVHRHLGRVRAGQQVGRGHQVEEVAPVDPAALLDDLLVHHRDVGDRPARTRPQPSLKNTPISSCAHVGRRS